MLKINGAWYVDQLPTQIVVELEDGSLSKVNLTPYREISVTDLTQYKGYHPRRLKGSPLPEYFYRFYGLEKNNESLTEVIHIRITPTEKQKLETATESQDKTTSELLRDFIRSL
ncbi:MAG: hypothetical protein WCS30_00270 [Selenomonadaceae bacterium]